MRRRATSSVTATPRMAPRSLGGWERWAFGNRLRFHVPAHVGIPDVVNEPGSVGEQMAKRDWSFSRPQSGLPRGIEAFEYLGSRKFGQKVCHLVVERKLALF